MNNFLANQIEDMRNWCKDRLWGPRAILVIYMAYVFINLLADPSYWSLMSYLNLGIHEFGHMLFTPLGRFMHFLGGSLFQCLVPVIGMVMFYRQRDYFAFFFAFSWLAINFYNVAWYVADARKMAIPLVSPFGPHAMHDWNYLLGKMGMLHWDKSFGFMLQSLGFLSMILGLVGMTWVLWEMHRANSG